MRRALPDYLKAADYLLHGFLLTIVVDKKLTTLFGPNEKGTLSELTTVPEAAGLGSWKPDSAEKLLRVVHSVAFLVGLLAESGQKIFWMSDNDTICANEDIHRRALELFSRAVSLYTERDCTFPVFGGQHRSKSASLGILICLAWQT